MVSEVATASLLSEGSTSPTKQPIFLFSEVRGDTSCYSILAKHFGTRDVVGVYDPAAYTPTPPKTLQAKAQAMVDAIRARQEFGPYLLAGWSFGGYTAMLAANILKTQHGQSANVIIFDTIAPNMMARFTPLEFADYLLQVAKKLNKQILRGRFNVEVHLNDAQQLAILKPEDQVIAIFAQLLKSVPEQFVNRHGKEISTKSARKILEITQANILAAYQYSQQFKKEVTGLFDATIPVTVFSASNHQRTSKALGWEKILDNKQLSAHQVPNTNHFTLIAGTRSSMAPLLFVAETLEVQLKRLDSNFVPFNKLYGLLAYGDEVKNTFSHSPPTDSPIYALVSKTLQNLATLKEHLTDSDDSSDEEETADEESELKPDYRITCTS